MAKDVVYLQKVGTLESFCVFTDNVLDRKDKVEITKKGHEALIVARAKAVKDEKAAKAEGFGSLADKAKAERVKKVEAKEAAAQVKKLAKKKSKPKAPAKPKAAPKPKAKKTVKKKAAKKKSK